MSFNSWLRNLRSALAPDTVERRRRRQRSLRTTTRRLGIEVFEDRSLPSTFTVLNLFDNGPGSLRAAVAAANANPGADAIDFATTGTIALTSGQLDITESLTIYGPGADALTVSGEVINRVFEIAGAPSVVIAGLTVANGLTVGSPGAGISMADGALTLDHVTVTGNVAYGALGVTGYGGDGLGGGLYLAGGTLTLNQCTVSWNSAVGTPGIDSYYYDIYSVGNGVGGGLYVAGGTLILDQSTLSENYARGGAGSNFFSYGFGYGGRAEGGGLYVAGGTVHVNQTTVSGNYSNGGDGGDTQGYGDMGGDGGSGSGGGIRVAGGSVEIRQSSIFDNGAVGGRGGAGPDYYAQSGLGHGGGLRITPAAPPLADLDTYTVSNTINNIADIDPNISGPYTSNGSAFNPTLAISDVSTLEGNTGTHAITFTVSVSAASNQTITVAYATAVGAAIASSDYEAQSGSLTFAPGETTKMINVVVIGDRLPEPNETFVVVLSNPTNAAIADGWGVGTIVDDEPRISIGDVTTKEGNTGAASATFTVTLSRAYDEDVVIPYSTANGSATAGSDYTAASGSVIIDAGQTNNTFTVQVTGDRLPEANETFFVNLSSPTNAAIADAVGVVTILDDEPHISISDVTKREGRKNSTSFTFTVTLSAAYDQPVTMSFATANGTATMSDNDYVAKTGTLTFAPGETKKTITITVKGDTQKEVNETFYLDLFGLSSNSLFAMSRGIGTILNDD